ncbi:MAG: hypothetical protein NC548_62760 [Lachnospiraceae bacterium]|nr:hypothetical protein [Lachnospiraceae bacterium]MCM1234655.1 hypothetical protein [Ruminococcus flavefaciens]
MKLEMDKIIFEDRYEVDEIEDALDTYASEHPDSRSIETVKKLSKLLDKMYMSW